MKLNDRNAIITGSSGIGYAAVEVFFKAGADVIIKGRSATQKCSMKKCWVRRKPPVAKIRFLISGLVNRKK